MKTITTREEFQEVFKSARIAEVDAIPLNDLCHLIFIDKRANGREYKVSYEDVFRIMRGD